MGVFFLMFGIFWEFVSLPIMITFIATGLTRDAFFVTPMLLLFNLIGIGFLIAGICLLTADSKLKKHGTPFTGHVIRYDVNYNYRSNGRPQLLLIVKDDDMGTSFQIPVGFNSKDLEKYPIGGSLPCKRNEKGTKAVAMEKFATPDPYYQISETDKALASSQNVFGSASVSGFTSPTDPILMQSSAQKFCQFCGCANSENAKFCNECGESF